MSNAIVIKDLYKTFHVGFFRKKAEVLQGVSLEVRTGEIFGFLGPNGAGKTTTLKILVGLIFPTRGSAVIFDKSVQEVDFKKEVGFLPDNPYFYSYLTGEEFLNFYGQLFGLSQKAREMKINNLLDLVDMQRARKLQLRKYSKGMLQRIGMAQALINDPKLVIMDEPMTGLDPVGRKDIRDIIVRLREEGKTVFFSTHILSDVEMICDRVAIMVKGKITGQGLLSELLSAKVRSVDVCFKNTKSEILTFLEKKYQSLSVRGESVFMVVREEEVSPLLDHLVREKVPIVSVTPHKESLEQLFLSEIR